MATDSDVTVVLGGKLPSGDGNGLAGMGYTLTKDDAARKQIRAAVILFDVAEVAVKTDDGSQKAKLRVRRIEVIGNPDDFEVMSRLLTREFERRTGQTTLPFDLETDVEMLLQQAIKKDPWIGKRTYPAGDVEPAQDPDAERPSNDEPSSS